MLVGSDRVRGAVVRSPGPEPERRARLFGGHWLQDLNTGCGSGVTCMVFGHAQGPLRWDHVHIY